MKAGIKAWLLRNIMRGEAEGDKQTHSPSLLMLLLSIIPPASLYLSLYLISRFLSHGTLLAIGDGFP